MIVAVCTPLLDRQSRSRTTAAVLTSVSQAAAIAPAPDLVILPDCSTSSAVGATVTAAMCTGFLEVVARSAREMGFWIAVGHRSFFGNRLIRAATVFDPDGDGFLRWPIDASVSPGVQDSSAWSVRTTPLGRWALCPGHALGGSITPPADRALGLAIVPASPESAAWSAAALASAARSGQCAICVAPGRWRGEAEAEARGAIVSATGDSVGQPASAGGPILVAELDMPAAPAEAWMEAIGPIE